MPCSSWPPDQQSMPRPPLERATPTHPAGREETTYPSNQARKLALAADGSLPPIAKVSSITATDRSATSTNGKTTVASIPPTGVLAARPSDIEIRGLLLQLRRELSAPPHTLITESSKPRVIDRPCFRAAEGSEIKAITTALDHVALGAEGLSPAEKEEFEGIDQPLFDVPLLDLPSPTGSDFGLLTSTPAKVRDRLIHVHREHVRTSVKEKGDETEILSDTEERQDVTAIGSIQGPALNMASGTKGIVIALARPPKKRRDSHEKTDIASNSGSNNKVAKGITKNDTTPPEKLAIANNEKASIKLLDEGALVDDESAGSIDPFVL
ncbi:hypothetical protein EYR40_009128 [Pleurotus pulmonarius]|nr:hypothetical protein EYR40_009128 [Pleurotus pulmonarius]